MPTAKQSEAVELALALDRYLRGDESVLSNPKYANHINKMRARAAEIEDAERRWEEDPVRFANEVWDRAEKIKATGSKKARMEAQASKMYEEARQLASADRVTKQLELDRIIQHGPKEDVECAGELEVFSVGGVPNPVVVPVVVRIMNRAYTLRPGINYNVPSVFAARYRQMQAAKMEHQARSDVLQQGMRARDLEPAMDKISVDYGTKRAAPPLVVQTDQGR